jgi:riboflavin biosynthesis pyrimidine reductase
LNADVVHAGLLDELCLTVSPRLIGGNGPRIFAGNQLDPPIELDVAQVIEEGGYFFYRLTVRDPDRRGSLFR